MELKKISKIEELGELNHGSDLLLVKKYSVAKGKFQGIEKEKETSYKVKMKKSFHLFETVNGQTPNEIFDKINNEKRKEMYGQNGRVPTTMFEDYGENIKINLSGELGRNYDLYVVKD